MKKALAVLLVLMLVMAAGCSLPVAAQTSQAVETTAEGTPSSTPETTPSATPETTATETPAMSPTPTETATPSPTPTPTPLKPLTVTEGKLTYGGTGVNVNITYPIISGMGDGLVQGNINDGVLGYLQGQAQEVESDASAAGGSHGTYTFSADYEVMRNDGMILWIFIRTSSYTGGANVGTDVAFVNIINTSPAQQPTLEELFTEGSGYAAVLNSKIKAQLAAMSDGDAYSFNSVSAHGGYYLTDTELVIVFPRYTIAPGAYGEPEFSIPLADLADILIPELQ